ncbi:MAG: adenylate/guanylate cyclase domain-containing protein [Microthrixaceae bacterium]
MTSSRAMLPVDDLGELGPTRPGPPERAAQFGRQVGQPAPAHGPGHTESFDAAGERDVTVLFVDLQGYTRFSESASPWMVVAMLNRFFRRGRRRGQP